MRKSFFIFLLAAVLTVSVGCAARRETTDMSAGENPAEEPRCVGEADYRVKVVDGKGRAVQGAVVRVCSADACVMAVSDENGLIEVRLPSDLYEVYVLKVPEGYEANGTETRTAPPGGGETVIVVERILNRDGRLKD